MDFEGKDLFRMSQMESRKTLHQELFLLKHKGQQIQIKNKKEENFIKLLEEKIHLAREENQPQTPRPPKAPGLVLAGCEAVEEEISKLKKKTHQIIRYNHDSNTEYKRKLSAVIQTLQVLGDAYADKLKAADRGSVSKTTTHRDVLEKMALENICLRQQELKLLITETTRRIEEFTYGRVSLKKAPKTQDLSYQKLLDRLVYSDIRSRVYRAESLQNQLEKLSENYGKALGRKGGGSWVPADRRRDQKNWIYFLDEDGQMCCLEPESPAETERRPSLSWQQRLFPETAVRMEEIEALRAHFEVLTDSFLQPQASRPASASSQPEGRTHLNSLEWLKAPRAAMQNLTENFMEAESPLDKLLEEYRAETSQLPPDPSQDSTDEESGEEEEEEEEEEF